MSHYLPQQYAGLERALLAASGATFVGLTTNTDPRLTGGKSNPHKGHVRKVMEGANVMVFQNQQSSGYDNMVKRRLEQEGKDPTTFQLSPRAWGHRIPGTPFIEHKGKYYLEVIFLRTGKVRYELDGHHIDKELVQGLPPRSEADQGGLENKVVIRTFSLDSITEVRVNKETFRF